MGRQNFVISRFMCTNCGKETIPIPRQASKKRHWAHLKKMYCPHCKGEYNAFEVVNDYDVEVFKKLYENGAFKQEAQIAKEIENQKREVLKIFKEEGRNL